MGAFLLVNAVGALLFATGWLAGTVARRRRWVVIAGALTVLALLVAKSVLTWKPVWEANLFPVAWYVFLQDYWIAAIGLLFFGFAAPQLPVVWNRWVLGVVALLVFAGGLERTRWIAKPEVHGEELYADAQHHRTQTTGFTCAPCACVTALSYVGISATERGMAKLCLTRGEEGTTAFNTYRGLLLALEGSPWRVRLVAAPAEDLLVRGRIAVIDWPQLRHAITVVGTGDGVTMHDPLKDEPKPWDLDTLRVRYGGTALLIEPR